MSDPATLQEYNNKFRHNQKMSGYGIQIRTHTPCPACASPDFMVCYLIDIEDAMKKGAVCSHCGRRFKAIFTVLPNGGKSFEIVQTGGTDIPSYLPKIKRIKEK